MLREGEAEAEASGIGESALRPTTTTASLSTAPRAHENGQDCDAMASDARRTTRKHDWPNSATLASPSPARPSTAPSVAPQQEPNPSRPQLPLELPAGRRAAVSASSNVRVGLRERAHLYHFSTSSNAIHEPCPFGSGCAKLPTALNRFLPTSAASCTGSGPAGLAGTSAVASAGLAAAPWAVWPSAASCASTAARGSHEMPSVAVLESADEPKDEVDAEDEATNVPRRR